MTCMKQSDDEPLCFPLLLLRTETPNPHKNCWRSQWGCCSMGSNGSRAYLQAVYFVCMYFPGCVNESIRHTTGWDMCGSGRERAVQTYSERSTHFAASVDAVRLKTHIFCSLMLIACMNHRLLWINISQSVLHRCKKPRKASVATIQEMSDFYLQFLTREPFV